MANEELAPKRSTGRPKGSLNRATAEVKKAAQKYTNKALKTLAKIMENGEQESARVAAAKELLDRGFGRPSQSVEHMGEGGGPVSIRVSFE
jgi:hypothetical protein